MFFTVASEEAVLLYELSFGIRLLLDSVAPCGATLSSKIHGFFLYVTHLLIFSKRVRGEICLFKVGRR